MNVPLRDDGRLRARCLCSVVINMGRHDNYSFNRITLRTGDSDLRFYITTVQDG